MQEGATSSVKLDFTEEVDVIHTLKRVFFWFHSQSGLGDVQATGIYKDAGCLFSGR